VSKHVQQRTGRAGFFIPRTKDQSTDTPVYHSAGTHHARFKGDIQRGVEQAIVLQHQPALTKRHDFSVSGGVMAANRAVPPFPNHLVVMNQHRTHGHFAFIPCALSQHQRVAHPVFMIKLGVGQRLVLQSKSGRHYTHPLWIRLFELLRSCFDRVELTLRDR